MTSIITSPSVYNAINIVDNLATIAAGVSGIAFLVKGYGNIKDPYGNKVVAKKQIVSGVLLTIYALARTAQILFVKTISPIEPIEVEKQRDATVITLSKKPCLEETKTSLKQQEIAEEVEMDYETEERYSAIFIDILFNSIAYAVYVATFPLFVKNHMNMNIGAFYV